MSNLFYKFQKFPRVILYIVCFPYIIYLGWKKENALDSANWSELIISLEKIQWFGGLSPRDLFLLGYAHCNLGRNDEAVKFLEIIQAPLKDIEEEACRYCTHAWALYKIGKVDQSKAILAHAVSEMWPAYRKEWVADFINSIKRDDLLHDNVYRPSLSIH